ncbi:uncharacterized protein LOC124207603 [Daphnia pulex]|uniref:uncharacterized protein LOC124207603 n=1 Tax=Daphnia pulex TaxID=6669 RepID=UPI001EDEC138|nr:uncharacterized protein LOC124207603 [Daphnia pulex]
MARLQLVWQLALVCVILFLAGQAQAQLPASNAAVEAAIRNPRYMRRQINCLLNESPCDNIGRTMRQLVPALIKGQCPGCSPQQHQQAMKVMNVVSQQYPQEYSRIYYTYNQQQG